MVKLFRETLSTLGEVNTLTQTLRMQGKEYTVIHANDTIKLYG